MTSTGFLDINGTDLVNLYYDSSLVSNAAVVSSALTFTSTNSFSGTIIYNINFITSSSATYTSSNVPNFAHTKLINQPITFTLPTTGVPDGYILHFRRNNGAASVTYNFSPNIFNASNSSVSTFATGAFSFSLIKYNTAWYIHHPPI